MNCLLFIAFAQELVSLRPAKSVGKFSPGCIGANAISQGMSVDGVGVFAVEGRHPDWFIGKLLFGNKFFYISDFGGGVAPNFAT